MLYITDSTFDTGIALVGGIFAITTISLYQEKLNISDDDFRN